MTVSQVGTSAVGRCTLCPSIAIVWADRALHTSHVLPAPAPTPPPAPAPTLAPTQPFALVYTGDIPAAWQKPGALVIVGRDNYATASAKAASAAGATVLVYLDAVVINTYGKYHTALFNGVSAWPGLPAASSWGNVADFRFGSTLQNQLGAVLEQIVAENPHIGGFFADDLGSRSWFPGFDWATLPATTQQAWRAGAVALASTFRATCVRHGLVWVANGTWQAGSGGGYPDANVHGCALADGGMWEGHTLDGFGAAYMAGPQWGRGLNLVVSPTAADCAAWAKTPGVAYATAQADYGQPGAPWGGFHVTPLPTKAS